MKKILRILSFAAACCFACLQAFGAEQNVQPVDSNASGQKVENVLILQAQESTKVAEIKPQEPDNSAAAPEVKLPVVQIPSAPAVPSSPAPSAAPAPTEQAFTSTSVPPASAVSSAPSSSLPDSSAPDENAASEIKKPLAETNNNKDKARRSFVQKELAFLLGPDDDVVEGRLTLEAYIENMDYYEYIQLFKLSYLDEDERARAKLIKKYLKDYPKFKKAAK